jgi:L-ascorbate metabolism protein UlaG (beta-lactamase superfamily)
MSTSPLSIRVTGGPTTVLEIGGLRLIADPTFDAPGEYVSGSGSVLVKTAPAAVGADEIGAVDAVLLSHDEHPDNLDRSGRDFLATAPVVLTTPSGAGRLRAALGDAAHGMAPWTGFELKRPDGAVLTVTSVPARHGPEGCEPYTGEVVGFVLTGEGLPTVYVSGDNAWLGATRQIAERFGPIDVALLFAGAARTKLFDGALLTLDSAQTAEAARILGARQAVPVHFNSWKHFSEGEAELRAAFAEAGLTDRLVLLAPGESVAFTEADLTPPDSAA